MVIVRDKRIFCRVYTQITKKTYKFRDLLDHPVINTLDLVTADIVFYLLNYSILQNIQLFTLYNYCPPLFILGICPLRFTYFTLNTNNREIYNFKLFYANK